MSYTKQLVIDDDFDSIKRDLDYFKTKHLGNKLV